MTNLRQSELIINPDGSIYHLHLKPGDIANTVILVGDPERVGKISRYFDNQELACQSREFCCHTGFIGGKRLSVISTGIGTDNIDIVLNELDALVNIDFETRQVKSSLTSLNLIRLGTSGSLREEIPIGSLLISEYAVGMDGLMAFYDFENEEGLLSDINTYIPIVKATSHPYTVKRGYNLPAEDGFYKGITLTMPGFYAPQNRSIRLESKMAGFFETIHGFEWNGLHITNTEMETAGIYSLAKLMGHKALSINAILANRITGQFSTAPDRVVEGMIERVLGMWR